MSFRARLRLLAAASCAALLLPDAKLAVAGSVPHESPQAAIEAAADAAQDAQQRVRIEGTVLRPDGGPAAGAVVVSSAGGQAAVGEDGSFALELALAPEALAVELTAVASAPGGSLSARRRLDGLRAGTTRHAGALILAQSQGCAPEWIPTFGGMPGTDYVVHVLAVFDDGTGPALYAAGDFESAGGQPANRIAKWDGQGWSALGSGLNDEVWSLTVFDDGSGGGPALYAGGFFTTAGGQGANRIARWDGQAWSPLSSGMNSAVWALTVFDDGAGPALYAGGGFTSAGGQTAKRIAKWDGLGWSALGSGVGNDLGSSVLDLAVFDDGSGAGPALYAGGRFTSAGGQAAGNVARWDGEGWSALGSGTNDLVNALAVFDDGSGAGPVLCAGGWFTVAGGQPAKCAAQWDGLGWSALGSGTNGPVRTLAVFDDGSGAGPALYAGGPFTSAGGQAASSIARWDGQGWSALASGADNDVVDLAVFDDGSGAGPALYAGGFFVSAGGQTANFIARWNGEGWGVLGSGVAFAVHALTVFDEGSGAGSALYAGGSFDHAGGQTLNHVARWDGQGWSPLGSGMNDIVYALAVFDDGSGGGPALHAGGFFTSAGGQAASGVAKWDGQGWSPLGSGASGVYCLAVFDDGAGPALYAGGAFTSAGGQGANRIARWDGQGWSPLASGANNIVYALAVFDGGSGAELCAGGAFTSAGGQGANHIARWDPRLGWSALASGVDFGAAVQTTVRALAVFDGALYAAGAFTTAGGQGAENIARWDGQGWSALAGGLSHGGRALAVFDDGTGAGPALYAGGGFTSAGGLSANSIAKWDGQAWSALSAGMEGGVYALTAFDDGSTVVPALHAGGAFAVSPAGDSYLAQWGCPAIEASPGCFGNPAALASSSTAPSLGSTFAVSLSSADLATGLGLLYLGSDGTDAAGCGFLAPGLGELLLALAPLPHQVGSSLLDAGAVGFALPVPDDPALVGAEVAFQGAVVGLFDPGLPIELSNALLVTITQ